MDAAGRRLNAPFGLILAGGRGRRMGSVEKPLLPLGAGTLISAVIERVAPQCHALAINTASADQRWNDYPFAKVPDQGPGSAGPLAGVLAGLDHLDAKGTAGAWLLSVPGDTPFLPRDLVERLQEALGSAAVPIVCAASGSRTHPVVALWSTQIREALRRAIFDRAQFSVRAFQAEVGTAVVAWEATPFDPFFNVNRPDDLEEAERLAGTYR